MCCFSTFFLSLVFFTLQSRMECRVIRQFPRDTPAVRSQYEPLFFGALDQTQGMKRYGSCTERETQAAQKNGFVLRVVSFSLLSVFCGVRMDIKSDAGQRPNVPRLAGHSNEHMNGRCIAVVRCFRRQAGCRWFFDVKPSPGLGCFTTCGRPTARKKTVGQYVYNVPTFQKIPFWVYPRRLFYWLVCQELDKELFDCMICNLCFLMFWNIQLKLNTLIRQSEERGDTNVHVVTEFCDMKLQRTRKFSVL